MFYILTKPDEGKYTVCFTANTEAEALEMYLLATQSYGENNTELTESQYVLVNKQAFFSNRKEDPDRLYRLVEIKQSAIFSERLHIFRFLPGKAKGGYSDYFCDAKDAWSAESSVTSDKEEGYTYQMLDTVTFDLFDWIDNQWVKHEEKPK